MTRTVRLCSFCLAQDTSASLDAAGLIPICWRPCYASLNLMRRGYGPLEALTEAFREFGSTPDAVGDMRALITTMNGRGFNPPETAARLVAQAFPAMISMIAQPGMAGLLQAPRA